MAPFLSHAESTQHTSRGQWKDTPWGAKAEYFDGILDEFPDCLAVVVATADLKHAEELH